MFGTYPQNVKMRYVERCILIVSDVLSIFAPCSTVVYYFVSCSTVRCYFVLQSIVLHQAILHCAIML
jgi:hypothetical protein